MDQNLQGSYKWEDAVYKAMLAQGTEERDTCGVACNVMLDQLLALPEVPQAGNLLEIGTGDGYNTIQLARRTYEVTSIEISDHAIHLARQRLAQAQISNVQILRLDATAMAGLEDNTFDVAVDSTCLHCVLDLEDRRNLLKEVHRVLKPGGSFVGVTLCQPFIEPLPVEVYPGIYYEGEILYGDLARQGQVRPVRRVRTAGQLRAELAQHGLAVIWSEHKILRKEPICYHFAYHAQRQ
jgi:ubiquinone/menaquinone biosynthesis C-methylase UbiE